jgi:RNase P/RNase MRP subunit p29
MVWDYKNKELKRFIQKTFSIKDDAPDTIEEDGRVWRRTRRIESLYVNTETGEKKVVDHDLYEFEFGKPPDRVITIDGDEWRWERNISGFATIADLNGVLKRSHSMKFETRFTKPPLDSDGFGYGIT